MNDTFRRNIIAKLPVLNTITNNVVFDSRKDVSDCICKFTDVINSVAEPRFSYVSVTKDKSYVYQGCSKKAEWFDNECYVAKQNYVSALNKYNSCKSSSNRNEFCQLKVIYKRIVKRKKNIYEHEKLKKIERLRHQKPKDFWKLFSKKETLSNDISTDEY